MRNIHVLLFILLLPILVFSQNPAIDSLRNTLAKTTQDTVKINTLNVLSEELIHINQYDSAFRYATSSKELAEKIGFNQGSANAYQNLVVYFLHQTNYESAKNFLLKSLAISLQTNNREAIANTYLSLYNVNEKQLNYLPALDNYKKHIVYRDSLANEKKQAEAALTAIVFEANKKKAFAINNATILSSVKEQKKEFIITAGIVTSLLVLALTALLVSIGRIKKANTSILSTNEATILALENSISSLKKEKEEAEALQKKREDDLEAQAAVRMPAIDPFTLKTEATNKAETVTDPSSVYSTLDNNTTTKNPIPFTVTPQFVSFTTHLLDGKITLNWSTANEVGIAYFEVDKSIDNQQFITIETIANIGFNDNNYQTFDLYPLPGSNYFRINMVDKQGEIVYSQTATVQSTKNVLLDLVRYPNPVKDVMMVTAVGGKSKVAVTIFDKIGKKIFNMEVPPTSTPVYLTNIEPGHYTLQMKSEGKLVVQKLVKQ